MNELHEAFSKTMGYSSLMDIQTALLLGATIDSSKHGFHARNQVVAQSDYLIAYTWGQGVVPKPGGTLNTWNMCKHHNKLHVPLTSLLAKKKSTTTRPSGDTEEECKVRTTGSADSRAQPTLHTYFS
jgi:hypothetical protein